MNFCKLTKYSALIMKHAPILGKTLRQKEVQRATCFQVCKIMAEAKFLECCFSRVSKFPGILYPGGREVGNDMIRFFKIESNFHLFSKIDALKDSIFFSTYFRFLWEYSYGLSISNVINKTNFH